MTAPADVLDELGADGRGRTVRELLRRLGVALPTDAKDGRTFAVACPFHHETNGTALVVMPDAGAVECKGACAQTWGLFDLAVAAGLAATRGDAADAIRREFLGRLHDSATPADGTNGNGHVKARESIDFAAWHARSRNGLNWTKLAPDDPRAALVLAAGYSLAAVEELEVGFAPERRKRDEKFPPALVFPVRAADGRIVAVKLRALGPAADGVKSRSVGPTGSGILGREQLDAKPDALVIDCAGEKDLAHGVAAAPEFAWTSPASGEGGGVGQLAELYTGRRVVVLFDKDAAGRTGAERVARELLGVAASVAVAEIPGDVLDGSKAEKDVADVCRKHGPAAGDVLRRIVEAARAVESTTPARSAARPEMRLRGEFAPVVEEALAALVASEGGLFVRGRDLVRVLHADASRRPWLCRAPGAPVIAPVTSANLRERLDRAARWTKFDGRRTKWAPALVPEWVAAAILDRGEWPFPYLMGVVEMPTLRADGTVLDRPGYDQATSLLYVPTADVPAVPAAPSLQDARAAADVLLDPFRDFPFRGDAAHPARQAARAAVLAAQLTLVGRAAIDGPVPLFGVSAPVAGSGKDLLVNAVSLGCTGRRPASMTYTPSDEEMRKRILAVALEGDAVVSLGNVETVVGSDSLAHALTAVEWKDRHLGLSKMASAPLRAVWLATGNNLRYSRTLGRRVVPIDLDPQMEHPEDRSGFAYPDLLRHVETIRPALVCAALTIWRAFFAAGCPRHKSPPMGSYESWDALVRSCVVWLGYADPASVTDPASARGRIRVEADEDLDGVATLLAALGAAFPGPGATFTAKDVVAAAGRDSELGVAILALYPKDAGPKDGKLDGRIVGNVFKTNRDRIVRGKQLVRAGNAGGGAASWSVKVSHGSVAAGETHAAGSIPGMTSGPQRPVGDSLLTHTAACLACGEPTVDGLAWCSFHADRGRP